MWVDGVYVKAGLERERGMNAPLLVMGDGHLEIRAALRNVWPQADEQRCWNHKVLNVLEQLPRQRHAAAKPMLRVIAYAPTRAEAERKRKTFQQWYFRHINMGRRWGP